MSLSSVYRLELEEMIVEARPLHKKKKRLAKQRSCGPREGSEEYDPQLLKEFIIYNRYKELKRKAMEEKELEWQRELDHAMANSEVDGQQSNQLPNTNLITVNSNVSTVVSTSAPLTITPNTIPSTTSSSFHTLDYIDRSPSPHSTHL